MKNAVSILVQEIKDINTSIPTIDASDPNTVLSIIQTKYGGKVFLNRHMEQGIGNIAASLYQQKPEVRNQYTERDWRRAIRLALVNTASAMKVDSKNASTTKKIWKQFNSELTDQNTALGVHFVSFGCGKFSDSNDSPFVVGPVTFQSRDDWLNEKLTSNQIDESIRKRIEKILMGKTTLRNTESFEVLEAHLIYNVISDFPIVCSVKIENLSPQLVEQRSFIAAQLARSSMCLLLPRLPSETINRFPLAIAHGSRQIMYLANTCKPHSISVHWKSSESPTDLKTGFKNWHELSDSDKAFYKIAGKMISCWTSKNYYDSESNEVIRSLSRSLHFFTEACREEDDLMAIIKFTAALEVLAAGKAEEGILRLCTTQLNKNENYRYQGGSTLKKLVKKLYKNGRSQPLHGTSKEILNDWRNTRELAESLSRECLVQSMIFISENPSVSELDALRK